MLLANIDRAGDGLDDEEEEDEDQIEAEIRAGPSGGALSVVSTTNTSGYTQGLANGTSHLPPVMASAAATQRSGDAAVASECEDVIEDPDTPANQPLLQNTQLQHQAQYQMQMSQGRWLCCF
jgi:hypothetical protein